MTTQEACQALKNNRRLEIRYDGYARVVEVHAVGKSKEGHGLMRVWQVRGGSVSGERAGWKLLRLDETCGHALLDEESDAPHPGYKRGDAAIATIVCRI